MLLDYIFLKDGDDPSVVFWQGSVLETAKGKVSRGKKINCYKDAFGKEPHSFSKESVLFQKPFSRDT